MSYALTPLLLEQTLFRLLVAMVRKITVIKEVDIEDDSLLGTASSCT